MNVMKNLQLHITLPIFLILSMMSSCSEDFITLEPKGQFLSGNYYANRDQAYTGVVAAYDVLRKNAGGFENMITMMNAGSDDHYAGGGGPTDGVGIQGFSSFTLNPNIIPGSFWSDHYQGVFRANTLLQKLPDVEM